MKKKQKTVWDVFKQCVNSQPIGAVITRQGIIKHFEDNGFDCYTRKIVCGRNENHYSSTTLDYIRNLSEKLGFLSKGDKSGMYVVTKHFPEDYTVSQLRKDYDERR